MPVSADLVSYKFSVEQDNIMSKTIKEFPKKKRLSSRLCHLVQMIG